MAATHFVHAGDSTLCLLLLLLLSSARASSPSDPSSTASADASTPSTTTFLPPPRTLTPTFPRLHILFVVGIATYTHVAAPIEYMLELHRRGHRVTWQQPGFQARWFGSEAERLSLPFNWSLVDVDGSTIDRAGQIMSERPWIEAFEEVVRLSYEPVYPVLYRATLQAIEHDRPDLLVCDSIADHCFDASHKLQLPAVISHCTTPSDGNAPWHFDAPSGFTSFSHRWQEQPLWHRLYNTYAILPQLLMRGVLTLGRRIDAMKRELGSPGTVNAGVSSQRRDVLYDSSWAWEWPQYWPPYLHMVGPIPKTWKRGSQLLPAQQRWLDDSLQAGVPVVYVAMGSLAKLTDDWLRAFVACFTSCPALPADRTATNDTSPFRVLWANRHSPQWLSQSLPSSVRLAEWVDQPAVLAHPAVRLFLSHSGMSSAQEAIAVGLPILALPLLIDQPPIAAKLRDRGVAEVLDKMTFTADEMCAAMRRLVYEPRVRQATEQLQRLFHKSDSGGLQRAVDVIERAAVSSEHLFPYRERLDVSWVVRYNVDVYGIGLAVVTAVLAAVMLLVRLAVRGVWRVVGASKAKSKLA